MPLIDTIMVVIITAFFLSMLILGLVIFLRSQTWDIFGNPPINRFSFIFGKISMFGTWLSIYVQAYYVNLRIISLPTYVILLAIPFAIVGVIVSILSFYAMGRQTRFGILEDPDKLYTSGIYAYSRHPSYFGFYLLMLSVVLYTLSIFTIIGVIIAIIIHHIIAKAEEKYLQQVFPKKYSVYQENVNRYFGRK